MHHNNIKPYYNFNVFTTAAAILYFKSHFLFTIQSMSFAFSPHSKWKVLRLLNANVNDTIVMRLATTLTCTQARPCEQETWVESIYSTRNLSTIAPRVPLFRMQVATFERRTNSASTLKQWTRPFSDTEVKRFMCYDLIFMLGDYDQVEPQEGLRLSVPFSIRTFAPPLFH